MFSARALPAEKYTLNNVTRIMLMNAAATVSEKTNFPPNCQPKDLLINQPQAKQKVESTNQTAKLLSPNFKIEGSKKFERNFLVPCARHQIARPISNHFGKLPHD